jgi:hypothetical protein
VKALANVLALERVDKKEIKKADKCPICDNPFLDGEFMSQRRLDHTDSNTDKYPLVVRLPCHKTHMFDLECIQPWLKLHSTYATVIDKLFSL